jgi:hypothetical protein
MSFGRRASSRAGNRDSSHQRTVAARVLAAGGGRARRTWRMSLALVRAFCRTACNRQTRKAPPRRGFSFGMFTTLTRDVAQGSSAGCPFGAIPSTPPRSCGVAPFPPRTGPPSHRLASRLRPTNALLTADRPVPFEAVGAVERESRPIGNSGGCGMSAGAKCLISPEEGLPSRTTALRRVRHVSHKRSDR